MENKNIRWHSASIIVGHLMLLLHPMLAVLVGGAVLEAKMDVCGLSGRVAHVHSMYVLLNAMRSGWLVLGCIVLMVVDGVLYSRIERQRGQKSSMAYAIAVGALLCTIGILVYTMVGYLLLV